ncbi:MAG: tetratricopeptide repeat protein [Rhodanobacteraceae bacterium]
MDFDWYGAKAACERALQLAPGDAQAKLLLGAVLGTLGQNKAGIASFRAALRLDPRDAGGWLYLGNLLWATGQLDAADRVIRKGIALKQTSGWT